MQYNNMFKSGNADYVVRSAIANISKFFSRGWGNPEILRGIGAFQNTVLDKRKFLRDSYSTLERTEIKLSKGKKINASMTLYNGEFISPLNKFIPTALPPECEKAAFQVILPNNWRDKKPVCIHLAGTGDHFFWRRRFFMASPLAKEHAIGSIILENPFYGSRKPKDQSASAVNYVSDIFVMGSALLVETIVLLLWCQRMGLGPLGITGISMGGHMASVAASGWFEPLSIVPCLSWTSAAPCFTDGVLSHTIHWSVLERQLQEHPEYMTILRDDLEFKRKLLTHYSKKSCLSEICAQQDNPGFFNSHYNQIYSSVSSFVSNIKPWSYIDAQGRKLGSMVVEADLWKYMELISKQIPDPSLGYKYLHIEMLKNKIWSGNSSDFQPSQETLDYMVTIMDQRTHLSHFNKPHKESSVIYVSAVHDRYMPRECYNLTPKDVWEQAEIRNIDSGHVLAVIQHQQEFRNAIKDSFQMIGCNF